MRFLSLTLQGFVLFSLLIFANFALSEPQVVFNTTEGDGDSGIYLLENTKGNHLESVNLTQHPAGDWEPSWSPDGKKIAFTSDRDGNYEIYTMDVETRKVERVTYYSGDDRCPAWCPKGGRIAFTSDRARLPDGSSDIYIIDLLTKETVRLTDHMLAGSPVWTPDGKKIAFAAILEGNEAICSIDPYGKVPVTSPDECEVIVEEPPPGARDLARWGFSFSPDLSMITFDARKSGGNSDIYTMDLSTGEFFNLTPNSPKHDRFPCWSPDGKFIAFSSSREGSIGGHDIYFITPEGEIIEQLKLEGYDLELDIFDPDFAYSVFPFVNSKVCTWGKIKQ